MAVEKVISIHVSELARKGDILLFLPGKEEVEQACMILQKQAPDLMTLPIYAALPFETQCQIFSSTPPGIRKVSNICYILSKYCILNGQIIHEIRFNNLIPLLVLKGCSCN